MNKWLMRAKCKLSKTSGYQAANTANRSKKNRITPKQATDITAKRDLTSVMAVGEEGESQISSPDSGPSVLNLQGWNEEEKSLIQWFMSGPKLPNTPFYLKQGVKICGRSKFCESLQHDISEGPTGPRSLYGALMDDLVHLKMLATSSSNVEGNASKLVKGEVNS